MRLTRKFKTDYYFNTDHRDIVEKDIEDDFHAAQAMRNKLGQLEDIEEDLNIDLNVFSKVLYALDKECVYVKAKKRKQYDGYSVDEETGEIERRLIVGFYRYTNGTRDWFFTISSGDRSSVNHYSLNEYGKTWALTREELS